MAPLHLLIVEDSRLLAQAFRLLFEESGYRVSVSETVAAAKAALGTDDTVDVMLLDLTLPDGNGLSVLTELHAEGGTPPRTTIALTGHDDDLTRERCLAAGCQTVLMKPISPRTLLAAVRACVADRH